MNLPKLGGLSGASHVNPLLDDAAKTGKPKTPPPIPPKPAHLGVLGGLSGMKPPASLSTPSAGAKGLGLAHNAAALGGLMAKCTPLGRGAALAEKGGALAGGGLLAAGKSLLKPGSMLNQAAGLVGQGVSGKASSLMSDASNALRMNQIQDEAQSDMDLTKASSEIQKQISATSAIAAIGNNAWKEIAQMFK